MSGARAPIGKRSVAAAVSMSLDAWTALDLMAEEDNVSASKMLQRLVNAEAKRRMDAKAAPVPEPEPVKKQRKSPVLSEERKAALRVQAARAREIRSQRIAQQRAH